MFFLLQTSKSSIFIKGFVYQCRSGLENMNVTTSQHERHPQPISSLGPKGWYWFLGMIRHMIRILPCIILYVYHIFRLKYRCFVYALSMIVPSLYRLPYIAPLDLYRIPKKIQNFKIFKNFIKFRIPIQNFKIFIKFQN